MREIGDECHKVYEGEKRPTERPSVYRSPHDWRKQDDGMDAMA
jgi:hypothetical protein